MGALPVQRFPFWVSGWVGGGSGWRKANPFDLRDMSGTSEDASPSGTVTCSYAESAEGRPDPSSRPEVPLIRAPESSTRFWRLFQTDAETPTISAPKKALLSVLFFNFTKK